MSIRLLIDKPTVGLRHLCENCTHGKRLAGPGYEQYQCSVMMRPITRMVTECDMFRAPDIDHGELVGQLREQAFHVARVDGELEVLSPEEMHAWDHWTDHNTTPFNLKRYRERQRAQEKKAQPK